MHLEMAPVMVRGMVPETEMREPGGVVVHLLQSVAARKKLRGHLASLLLRRIDGDQKLAAGERENWPKRMDLPDSKLNLFTK